MCMCVSGFREREGERGLETGIEGNQANNLSPKTCAEIARVS